MLEHPYHQIHDEIIGGVQFFTSNWRRDMPYITEAAKARVEEFGPSSPGELTYLLTEVIMDYYKKANSENGMSGGLLRPGGGGYGAIAEILGCLESTKLEFYRRIVVPYEFKKMNENGDVFPKEV